jgi:predicted HTH transcriptional regulator
VIGIAGILIAIVVLLFFGRELLKHGKRITVQEALKSGESLTVEFKSTFQWDVRQEKPNDEMILETLKSIAGFLNAKGGQLFIGIEEDKKNEKIFLRGIHDDLKLNGDSKDNLKLKLSNYIFDRIVPEFSDDIEDYFEKALGPDGQDQEAWVIAVKSAREPAFVQWHGQTKFYVRQGPRTSDLDTQSTWHYIKNKWG